MKKLNGWFGALWHVLKNERGEVALDTDKDEADKEVLDEQTQDDELETEEVELEDWQKEETETEDDQDPDYQVDGKLHQAMKTKLKGRVADRDAELERLRKERDDALRLKPAEKTALIKPKQDDFDTDAAYETALEKYNDDRAVDVWNRKQQEKDMGAAQANAQKAVGEAVDAHYGEAAEIIEKSGIKPEVYKAADTTVRRAVESVFPNRGDASTNLLISKMGKGSAKVIYYLGKNPRALDELASLLKSDPDGISASMYLGRVQQRLTNPIKPRSNAPDPASEIKGDEATRGAANKFKKTYDAASKKDHPQDMYNAKKAARAAGVDVSEW